jgi:hypothetical protein
MALARGFSRGRRGATATPALGTGFAKRAGMTVLSIQVFCVVAVLLLALAVRDAQ